MHGKTAPLFLGIDRYSFFWADTGISATHELIANTDISTIFNSCFLPHCQKYNVYHALPFFKDIKIRIYELKFFKFCNSSILL